MTLIRDNELSHLCDCTPGTLFRYRGEPGEMYALVAIDYETGAYSAVKLNPAPDGRPDRMVANTPKDGGYSGNANEGDVYLYRAVT